MDVITVSFILPCFNCERWLGPALDSLLAQTRGDWEAIVVDDGSTDASAAVAEDYGRRDGRIRLLRKENGGVGSARNAGAAAARGRFLNFFDADDLLHPEFLEVMLGALEAQPGWAGVACDYDLFNDAGPCGVHPLPASGERLTAADLIAGQPWAIHGALVERSLFERLGGFETSLKNAEDWDFWLRALVEGDFLAVRRTLAHYRQHPQQKSRNYLRIARHVRLVLDRFARAQPALVTNYGRDRFMAEMHRQMMAYAWRARRDGQAGQAASITLAAWGSAPLNQRLFRRILNFWAPLSLINAYRRLRGLRPLDQNRNPQVET